MCSVIVLEPESPRLRCRKSGFLVRPPFLTCRSITSPCVLTRPFFCVCSLLVFLTLQSFGLGAPPLWSRLTLVIPLKALSSNTVTLAVGALTYEFGGQGEERIQSITLNQLIHSKNGLWVSWDQRREKHHGPGCCRHGKELEQMLRGWEHLKGRTDSDSGVKQLRNSGLLFYKQKKFAGSL